MASGDRCELHDAAILVETGESEVLLRLAHSPIGDECHQCGVCRWARTYIERRLAERGGRALPAAENAEAAWHELQGALVEVRSSMHRTQ